MTADTKYKNKIGKTLLAQTKAILYRFDLRVRKSLGQHFLVDSQALATVVATAELTTDDIVIEVGSGLGILTRELAERAGYVITIELDDRLATVLKQDLAAVNNVTVINKDILKISPAVILERNKGDCITLRDRASGYKVVANLPYYITAAVLRHFLEASPKPRLMVVMLQKEVAESIVAKPGNMSLLSVSVQVYGKPEIISYIPADSFYPIPTVDSAILKIDIHPQPLVPVDEINGFFGLVRASFCAPRKQLVNALAQGMDIDKTEVKSLLNTADIEYRRRAETLSLVEWQRLWRVFRRK
jgi:16S rRNA (adenine1518-N6/adenine1519-N6)-dimethyltransferase